MQTKEKVIKVFDIVGIDVIGSRSNGETLRNMIFSTITKEKKKVVLDFENIRVITHSFADELLGIFVREFGKNFVKENIRVVNASENIKKTLNVVINYSQNIFEEKVIQ